MDAYFISNVISIEDDRPEFQTLRLLMLKLGGSQIVDLMTIESSEAHKKSDLLSKLTDLRDKIEEKYPDGKKSKKMNKDPLIISASIRIKQWMDDYERITGPIIKYLNKGVVYYRKGQVLNVVPDYFEAL